ncbi:hypothetical protein GCM10027605_47670 [Micromonospora zhanjiangensis]
MPASPLPDVVAALRDFVDRIDALDPEAALAGAVDLHAGDDQLRLTLSQPVARALVEALRGYRDPRDRGRCEHCGGRRDPATAG